MSSNGASAALTRAAASPTGLLLQNSRLFSLPKPLTHSPITDKRKLRGSETSTQPYPVYQAITTPQSSRVRGDWGLKRNLPVRRTNRTSTPAVRVVELDTIEKVTDYESASDHAITLKKWQQMGLSISATAPTETMYSSTQKPTSAFDSYMDNTTAATAEEKAAAANAPDAHRAAGPWPRSQWKYTGPAVPHMSPLDFDLFLQSLQTAEKAIAFSQFLRRHILEQHIKTKTAEALEEGRDLTASDTSLTEPQIQSRIKTLRDEMGTPRDDRSELHTLISRFLDLPSAGESSAKQRHSASAAEVQPTRTTHPSAGLSYLRSHAVLNNHPILGPQLHAHPVEARVLHHPNYRMRKVSRQMLGIGGIVAFDALGTSSQITSQLFDPEVEGGQKVWVRPTAAQITPGGRITLSVVRPTETEVHVHKGELPPNLPIGGNNPSQRMPLGRLDKPTYRKIDEEVEVETSGNRYTRPTDSATATQRSKAGQGVLDLLEQRGRNGGR